MNGVKTYYLPLANIFAPWEGPQPPVRRAVWHLIDAYNPIMGQRVGKILDRERPDVVDVNNLVGFSVAVWRAAKQRNIPVVQSLRDYYLACPNSCMLRDGKNCARQCWSCRVYSLPRRALSNIPSAVVAVSNRTLERLEGCGLFSRVGIKVVIHGIGIPNSKPPQHKVKQGSELVVGFLGRIERTKGLEILLDAAVHVSNVRVLIGGSGSDAYVKDLKERYLSERVEFAGYVQPTEFFERIDVLAVPSIWEEPLGRVIYEAYSHGVPVIVPRAGGMPEIVEEGKTGFILPLCTRSEFKALLERLSQDWQPQAFFDACLEKSKEFCDEHRFEKFVDVWSRVVAARAAER
jgi:glycosyltransferase involved in cell wall biosynthesis